MATLAKAGRYEIVGELGRGAMGVVYKATDPVIGRTVAVKTIKLSEEGTGLSRPELLARFQTEARAAGLLTHPNIVVVFDAGEENGLYYITMELVEGKSLQGLLDAGQMFPLPRMLRIMEQTLNALQFAHERNVVHRDVKPANIMLTGDDTVKVTDFGTAKILQFGTAQQTAHVMGTPSYMSPEQVKGRAVDGRSDIFSLGVMLYEMLTGEKPFPGQNITTVIYKIVNEDPIPPQRIDPTIHPGISAITMKALVKEPELRYQSCREMLEDLRNYRSVSMSTANPQSTVVLGGRGSPNATIATGAGGLAGMHAGDTTAAAARSLISRAATPTQTPRLRRTGSLPPYQQPKKNNVVGTVLAALFLLGVIGYGANKLRPIFYDVRQHASVSPASVTVADPGKVPSDSAAAATEPNPAEGDPKDSSSSKVEKRIPRQTDSPLTPKAAEYKRQIDAVLAQGGLAARAQVHGNSNTLIISGKLRPAEHSALLKFLHGAPSVVRIVDHIEYDEATKGDAPNARGSAAPAAKGLFVSSRPAGADVFINGAKQSGQTPITLPIPPGQYNIVLTLEGYERYSDSVQVRDNAQTQLDAQLVKKSTTTRVAFAQVDSKPPGAEIFIDGKSTEKFTPSRLQLPPGIHTVTLKLDGFRTANTSTQVVEGSAVPVTVSLQPKE